MNVVILLLKVPSAFFVNKQAHSTDANLPSLRSLFLSVINFFLSFLTDSKMSSLTKVFCPLNGLFFKAFSAVLRTSSLSLYLKNFRWISLGPLRPVFGIYFPHRAMMCAVYLNVLQIHLCLQKLIYQYLTVSRQALLLIRVSQQPHILRHDAKIK